MTTETETARPTQAVEESSEKADALDWAVYGCLVAGAIGIYKACEMDKPTDILVCLLGSLVAFGVVFYVHLRKH